MVSDTLLPRGRQLSGRRRLPRHNIATAGGCLVSQYLAAWVIARLEGIDAAREAMHYLAPVGEKEEYVERMLRHVVPCMNA
jgi:hypothetical protein